MPEAPSENSRSEPEIRPRPERLESVDLLRGFVIVLMAIDHVRDFFTISHFDPTDLAKTTPALFLTRWITHFCAPTFMFLAGVGAYLARAQGKSKPELARYLIVRGILLIILEQTVAKWGLLFNVNPDFFALLVLSAIGCSMIALAVMLVFPTPLIALAGLIIVAGHNLLDGIIPSDFGNLAPLWTWLHEGGVIDPPPGLFVLVGYPVGPWIGVIALGYGIGPILLLPKPRRFAILLLLGSLVTAGFVLLRLADGYGDPRPRSPQPNQVMTILSFLNCSKYPPSLLFLMMTLGPALLVLAVFDRAPGAIGRILITFGRVPLFFYVFHWWVAHGLAVAVALVRGQNVAWLFLPFPFQYPKEFTYGYDLPGVYLAWAATIALMYPLCKRFGELKRRRNDLWLKYF